MAQKFDKDVRDILESAVKDKLENFEIKIHGGNEKGEGFLGEIIFVSLKDKSTGEDKHVVIKKAQSCANESTKILMTSYYFNEIHFYSQILPALRNFEKSYSNVKRFDHFTTCLATCSDSGFEKLAFENLKFKNFKTHPKPKPFDTKSFNKLFKMYGEFHGLTSAFNHHYPEEYAKLTKPLWNNFVSFTDNKTLIDMWTNCFRKIAGFFEGDIKILEKLKVYLEDCPSIFGDCLKYKGIFPIFLHGDCWSNNLMFTYNIEGEIDEIKMIDFQLCTTGSLVLDLSYSFYSGADQECLDNLDHFLEVYYDALSNTRTQYGCDTEKLYPFETFKKEWKEYCRFGFLMGVILWATKNAYDLTDMPSMDEMLGESPQSENMGMKIDEDKYKERVMQLVQHVYDRGFI